MAAGRDAGAGAGGGAGRRRKRNKEKVLVLSTRGITPRCVPRHPAAPRTPRHPPSPSPSPSASAGQGAAVPARDHAALHLSAASEAWLLAVLRLMQSDALAGEEGWRVALLVACAEEAQACLRGVWATMGAHLLASAREAARLEAAVQAEGSP